MTTLTFAGVIVWITVPILILAGLSFKAANAQIEKTTFTATPVERYQAQTSRPVEVAMTWQQPSTLVAPSWAGLVEEVSARVGQRLTDGSTVAVISGITRTLAVTPRPFGRALEEGDRGSDVEMLNALLRAKGKSAPTSDVFGTETRQAVMSFARDIGVRNPDQVTSFDPAWVVFAEDEGTVSKVELQLAGPAPSAGAVVIETQPQASSASLRQPNSAPSDQKSEGDGSVESILVAAKGETLEIGGVAYSLEIDGSHLAPEALDSLSGTVEPNTEAVPAVLVKASTQNDWLVPAASVIVDGESLSCIFIRDGDDATKPIPVEVQGSVNGRAVVSAELRGADMVVVYPPNNPISCKSN